MLCIQVDKLRIECEKIHFTHYIDVLNLINIVCFVFCFFSFVLFVCISFYLLFPFFYFFINHFKFNRHNISNAWSSERMGVKNDFRNVAVFTMSRFCLYNSVVIVKMICIYSICCNWKKYMVNFFDFWIFSPIVTTRPFPLTKNNIENGREVTIAIPPHIHSCLNWPTFLLINQTAAGIVPNAMNISPNRKLLYFQPFPISQFGYRVA